MSEAKQDKVDVKEMTEYIRWIEREISGLFTQLTDADTALGAALAGNGIGHLETVMDSLFLLRSVSAGDVKNSPMWPMWPMWGLVRATDSMVNSTNLPQSLVALRAAVKTNDMRRITAARNRVLRSIPSLVVRLEGKAQNENVSLQ